MDRIEGDVGTAGGIRRSAVPVTQQIQHTVPVHPQRFWRNDNTEIDDHSPRVPRMRERLDHAF